MAKKKAKPAAKKPETVTLYFFNETVTNKPPEIDDDGDIELAPGSVSIGLCDKGRGVLGIRRLPSRVVATLTLRKESVTLRRRKIISEWEDVKLPAPKPDAK